MYVYRFLDGNGKVIYIGKAKSINARLGGHGHLDEKCYKSIDKVEYIQLSNDNEARIYEIYYINKYEPKYNKEFNKGDKFGFELPEKEWVVWDGEIKYKKNEIKDDGLREKIKYHEKRGDIILKYGKNYHVYTKERVQRNINRYKRLFNNTYYYKNVKEALKYIFSFKNNCTLFREDKIFYNKNLSYEYGGIKGILKSGRLALNLNLISNPKICFDFENNEMIIYFQQGYYVELNYKKKELGEVKSFLNNNFKHKNFKCQEGSFEGLSFIDCPDCRDVINCWEDFFIQQKEDEIFE